MLEERRFHSLYDERIIQSIQNALEETLNGSEKKLDEIVRMHEQVNIFDEFSKNVEFIETKILVNLSFS